MSKVLVVDDELTIRQLLADIMEELGYQVETAADESTALILARQERFDLVITDMLIAGTTGLELLTKVRKIDPDLPVILHTGPFSWLTQSWLDQHGFTAFISKPAHFSEFEVTISRILGKGPSATEGKKRETIVIVDDEEGMREVLTIQFEKSYRVLTAVNGAQALALIQAEHPHLVITDQSMPKMTGPQLLAALRASGNFVPMILIGGYANERRSELLALGFADVFGKPCELAEVEKAVSNCLNGQ